MSVDVPGIVPPFYLRNGQEWVDRRENIVISDAPLAAPVYEKGIILPLRPRADVVTTNRAFEGGACDANGTFVGGHARSRDPNVNLGCSRGYDFDEQSVRDSDERVVFGGVLYNHFGHQLVDTVSRLWYVAEHGLDGRKLVFVMGMSGAGKTISDMYEVMLAVLGVSPWEVLIVEEPTRFAEVVVPEEALCIRDGANAACVEVFRRMRDSVEPGTCEKVFLSRKSFATQDCINEVFLEEFYVRRGFRSVCPELLSKQEQIALLSGAHEVVSTLGTMSHLATLFSRDGAKLTYYVRAREVVSQQLLLDKLCGKQPCYVDATRSPLPTTHSLGAFLFGPTRCMRAYLDDAGIAYREDELGEDALTAEDVVAFLQTYERACEKRSNSLRLVSYDLSDVLVSLREGLDDGMADREAYRDASCRVKWQAAAQDRLLRASDYADLRRGSCAVRASMCAYRDGRLSLTLTSWCFVSGMGLSIVLTNEADGRRELLSHVECHEDPDETSVVADVDIDVAGFLRKHLGGVRACERWDLRVVTEEGEARIGLDEGKKPFIDFTRFFLCEGDWLLVPHLSVEGGMCFWLLGERRNDFSEDFFASRMNRPLVNDLLFRLIRAERYRSVLRLYKEFSRGRLWCVPLTDGTVFFEDKRYYVASYAYQEACALRRPQNHERVSACWKWVKRARRLKRIVLRMLRGRVKETDSTPSEAAAAIDVSVPGGEGA